MDDFDGSILTRRRVLATGGALATTALAGCSGGGGGDRQVPIPVLGDPDADVTVAAYEDFHCGHCRTYNLEYFPALAQEYIDSGIIRYEHRDFPVGGDRSWKAANAAKAVQAEGSNRAFWRYAKLLFENQSSLNTDAYVSLAGEVGVDGEAVRSAVEDRTYDPTIEIDRSRGRNLGIQGTPTLIVNGEFVTGPNGNPTYHPQAVARAIEDAR